MSEPRDYRLEISVPHAGDLFDPGPLTAEIHMWGGRSIPIAPGDGMPEAAHVAMLRVESMGQFVAWLPSARDRELDRARLATFAAVSIERRFAADRVAQRSPPPQPSLGRQLAGVFVRWAGGR